MSIDTVFNKTLQISDVISIDDQTAIKVVDFNERRIELRFKLPMSIDIICAVIASSEADANALKGEIIGQDFSSNANRVDQEVIFDTNSDAQGEKWALVNSSIMNSLSGFDLSVNEYIG